MNWSGVSGDKLEGVGAPEHSGVLVTGDLDVGTVLYGNSKVAFPTKLLAINLHQQDLLGFKLTRIAINDGSNPAVNPVVLQVEMVATLDKLGEKV